MALRQFKETGEMIDLHPPKVVEQDTFRLCGTRHTIQVGVTRNQDVLTPFDDYFFVSFSPEDTSGGGKAMDWVTDRFEDAKEWAEDVGTGFEYAFGEEHEAMRENVESISEKMCKNCKTWACKGKWCMGAAAVNTWNTLGELSRLWAETDESSPSYTPFRADEKRRFASGHTNCNNDWYELTGGCYHALEGAVHKIRIVITNTYDGRTTTKFDSELAGCFASYEADDDFCPSGSTYKRFIINSPGEWVIKITPLGFGTCEPLEYTHTYKYSVREPEGWKPSPLQTMTTDLSQTLQDAGLPVYVTPLGFVGVVSLLGGLIVYKTWKKRKN